MSLIARLLLAVFLLAAPAAFAADDPLPPRKPSGLALTPPMGWNSWNRFGCGVDEAKVRGAADALVASGMKAAGYDYVVIDDCWHGARDAHGDIQADPQRFPSGIKALADYVHAKGLKFGIYSDAGTETCAHRPGSRGHEYQDAAQYARWGVDYLKYDWCSTYTQDAPSSYLTMSDALRATGRPIVLSICEWGTAKPWLWARNVGELWRTTGDIHDAWQGQFKWESGIMDLLDHNVGLESFAGPGGWNDPDMLEVGNGGMTDTEYRAHFSLWAILAAPLIAGNDLTAMSPATRAILLNREVIAVDQDRLGMQGRRAVKDGDAEVWVKPLAGDARAVVLLNRGTAPRTIAVDWETLGYPAAMPATVRDLWSGAVSRRMRGRFAAQTPPHGVTMVRIEG